ncbi:Aste57867_25299 [Aphanomyces stellatus]|uniref:Aste57867_25299 protein n=1 Tax=Aphanomyces stellatus TaxID=120398 RepID=A0A485LST0_9STRA|nr:hypothetical protein As57867_025221 [Aphanomyces stellatus]VFU01924.1 Aste57867_25299 [Aphanomyces stellatus]
MEQDTPVNVNDVHLEHSGDDEHVDDVVVNREEEDDEDVELEGGDMEVELGFLGDETGHLEGPFGDWDGGKVGGSPVWLHPNQQLDVKCSHCEKSMSFLLQIYCPLDFPDQAFHRSLYLFVCRTAGCVHLGHARAFRSQLPQENPYYANHQDIDYRPTDHVQKALKRCALCGLKATFSCSACHIAHYCSKEHQKDHWKSGGHKEDCHRCAALEEVIVDEVHATNLATNGSKYLFPEYSIHIDREPDRNVAQNETEAKMIRDFEAAKAKPAGNDVFTDDSDIDLSQKELSSLLGSSSTQDKTYLAFLTRVALANDQVLRYCRWNDQGDAALWVHGGDKPDAIPACAHCGEPREFEFQVMPQLLYHLKLAGADSIEALAVAEATQTTKELDWGTLAVYTCPNSCSHMAQGDDVDLVEEFVWRQSPMEELEIKPTQQ